MKNLHKNQMIRHASGDSNKPFIYGFYLFYIISAEKGIVYLNHCQIIFFILGNIFVEDEKEFQPSGDIQVFENEWMEVEVKPPLNWGLPTSTGSLQVPNSFSDIEHGVPHFLCDEIDANYSDCDLDGKFQYSDYIHISLHLFLGPMYKRMRLETDVGSKSDRMEWGHAKYQTVFRPDQACELVVEWLTSSGAIIFELVRIKNNNNQ